MSLYGLDLIVDKKDKFYLIEINGIAAGMRGFREVYGDDRVEKKVYSMLRDKYGKITLNDGVYINKQESRKLLKKHPIIWLVIEAWLRVPYLRKRLFYNVRSDKADVDWINEVPPNSSELDVPFEPYSGQESAVFNVANFPQVCNPINPYEAEEITRNKFLQYLLIKDTRIGKLMPQTALVGMGWAWEDELYGLMDQHQKFVLKPVLGRTGLGVKVIGHESIDSFLKSKGAVRYPTLASSSLLPFSKTTQNIYLEDLIDREDYGFEQGVSVIQPFIDSKLMIDGDHMHTSIRAIVCNGEFVDAYLRYRPEPVVNISQGAHASYFEMDGLDNICEEVVEVFETEAINSNSEAQFSMWELENIKPNPQRFKKILYGDYLDVAGRTSESERMCEAMVPLSNLLFEVMTKSIR